MRAEGGASDAQAGTNGTESTGSAKETGLEPLDGGNGVPFVGSNHTQEYNLKRWRRLRDGAPAPWEADTNAYKQRFWCHVPRQAAQRKKWGIWIC
eukprot:scaffold24801_cov107-Phaeocystis_antarctica.AAC.2